MTDEFDKKMHFASFVGTLADTVVKMNPSILVSQTVMKDIESAGVKDQYQKLLKDWMDMYDAYIRKASFLGSKYPIEDILGIKSGDTDARRENP